MLLTAAGFELVEHLERQRDVPSLLASFQRVVRAFGMTAFCIGDPGNPKVKRQDRRWDGSWPDEIYRRYANLNFFSRDPTVTRMNACPEPFRWSDNYKHKYYRPEMQRIRDEVFHMDVDGLAIPIHGRNGAVTGVSIGTTKYELSRNDERSLQMASLYLHARMTVLRPETAQPPMRGLTPRERECLQWVAAGKTDWEISQILNISEQTAHGYVQSALTKLDARTRAQAVALALSSSQILP
jgi:LuxR family quorum sensing-dependent transcriptional regulator